jgi:hypothetical protein
MVPRTPVQRRLSATIINRGRRTPATIMRILTADSTLAAPITAVDLMVVDTIDPSKI